MTTDKTKNSVRLGANVSIIDTSLPTSYIAAIEILSQQLKLPQQTVVYAFLGTSFIAENNYCSLFITALHNKNSILHTEKLGDFKSDGMIDRKQYDICAKTIACKGKLSTIPISKTIPKNGSKVLFCGYPGNSNSAVPECRCGIVRGYNEATKCFFIEGENECGMSGGPVLFQDTDGIWKAFAVISAKQNQNVNKQDIISNSNELMQCFGSIKSKFNNPYNCMIAVSLTALEIWS